MAAQGSVPGMSFVAGGERVTLGPVTMTSAQPPANTVMILTRSDGSTTAYCREKGTNPPGIVFFPGFRSDMGGTKATSLAARCRERGRPFLRFDYFGHGASSGDFQDGRIGRWLDDALAVLDELTEWPQILVGSSMGGWIALLAARARADRVAGLVGIAPAPDFTEDLIWNRLSGEQRRRFRDTGVLGPVRL